MNEPNELGEGCMQPQPAGRKAIYTDIEADSPHLSYTLDFTTPGTYYIWLKGRGPSTSYRHVHYGLNGISMTSSLSEAFKLEQASYIGWYSQTGSGARPTITIDSAKKVNLDLWMCQAGTIVDRILLTTDSGYVPVDPPESPHP